MSDTTIPPGCPDRNLLFGVVAMQLDFINRSDLLLGLQAWNSDRNRSLGQVLIDRQAMSPRRRVLLDELVEEFLIQYDGDPSRGLAAACAAKTLPLEIEAFAGPALRGDLGTLPSSPLTLPGFNSYDPPPPPDDMAYSSSKRFRILRPHARGALGEVYLAQDEELNREVALKEIQSPYAANLESRSRFLIEAKITGSLEHPGIVPVYSLGSYPDGRPYYAMRFIRGASLHEAIARFHHADLPGRDPSERTLALRALLSRFVGVCNAVAYAHSRGVVHRDIKPSNIMLGPYGETLVVDWGLAKIFDRPVTVDSQEIPIQPVIGGSSRATMMGQAVGTPSFMPPEQAAGKVDHVGPRSDVYSLGATLYNLLTGIPPYPSDDADEIINQVVLGRPMDPPRRVKRDVHPALEAIVLKATQYAAKDRYQSVNELAQEVERWLADEPVLAYPEPAWQRMQRWTRRHRTLVSGFAVLLMTALLGLMVGLYAVRKEQAETQKNLLQAKENLELARKAVDECFVLAKEGPLLQQEQNRAVRSLLFRKALPFYRDFQSKKPDDPSIRAEIGLNLFRVAFISEQIEDKSEALATYEKARDVYASLVSDYPQHETYRDFLATVLRNLGTLHSEAGQRDLAEPYYRQALDLMEGLARGSNAPEYQRNLASIHNNLAVFLRKTDKLDKAKEHYRIASKLQTDLVKSHPDLLAQPEVLLYYSDLAATKHNLGGLLVAQNDPKGALRSYEEARDIRDRLVKARPTLSTYRADLANTLTNLGALQRDLEDRKQALESYKKARDLRYELYRPYSDVGEYRNDLASTYTALGMMLHEDNKDEEANKFYRDALEIQEKLTKDKPNVPFYQIDMVGTRVNLANLICDKNEPANALLQYDRAFSDMSKLSQSDRERPEARQVLFRAHYGKARALQVLGLHQEAAIEWGNTASLDPLKDRDWSFRRGQALALARAGKSGAALALVAKLEKLSKPAAGALYDFACVHALAKAALETENNLNAYATITLQNQPFAAALCSSYVLTDPNERSEAHAARALRYLEEANKLKLFDDKETLAGLQKKDDDLRSLRGRDDFKKFLKGLPGGKTGTK